MPTAAVLRTNGAYALQTSTAEPLKWGVAYTSPAFPGLVAANQLRECVASTEDEASSALDEVEAYFAARELVCWRWAPASDQPFEAMGQFLWERGYRRRRSVACGLVDWAHPPVPDDVRVLPARPLRSEFRDTFFDPEDRREPDHEAQRAAAGLERLDHAGFHALVAMLGGRPAGRCALFHVGDVGRVTDLYVQSGFRRRGVGTALVAHAIELAKRYAARTVCVEVEATNQAALRCLERLNFNWDRGSPGLVEFLHPEAVPD